MSACRAIEDACGVVVDGQLAALRRLLYCGEWIESQTLHIHMLHAPDFLGEDDVIGLSRSHLEHVERGLRLKQTGNAVVELLGGRAIHPVNVRIGGFHRAPTRAELRPLEERLRTALDDAWDTVRWVAGFEFPDAECTADLLALAETGTYAIESGVPTVLPYDETLPPYSFPCGTSPTTWPRSRSPTLPPSTPGWTAEGTSPAPSRAGRSAATCCPHWLWKRHGRPDWATPSRAGAGRGRSAGTRTEASSSGRWKSCTRWRRP